MEYMFRLFEISGFNDTKTEINGILRKLVLISQSCIICNTILWNPHHTCFRNLIIAKQSTCFNSRFKTVVNKTCDGMSHFCILLNFPRLKCSLLFTRVCRSKRVGCNESTLRRESRRESV